MKELLQKVWAELDSKKDDSLSAIVGMDGFVDEIVHLVDKRQDVERFDRLSTIQDFGEMVLRAAGLSTNIEMVPVQVRAGGNSAYLSNALLAYGVKVTHIGALGDPVHPVYHDLVAKAEKTYTLCNPGRNICFEFDDGKLMVLEPDVYKAITWERIKEVVGPPETIAAMLDNCDIFSLLDWSLVFNQNDNMQSIIDEVFPLMKKRQERPIAFFDLSDPEKRTKEDILAGMKLISQFEGKFRTVLGLNEKELYQIAEAFDIPAGDLESTTTAVYQKMGIHCVMAHPVKEACCCVDDKYYRVDGPFCAKPLTTTGAGDNFNSGFCLGLGLGLDPMSALTLGVCASGFFVRNAKSATYAEIMDFAKKWAEDGSI
jgi:sugar/nucleoside kinase (ribokinase family)